MRPHCDRGLSFCSGTENRRMDASLGRSLLLIIFTDRRGWGGVGLGTWGVVFDPENAVLASSSKHITFGTVS